MLYYVLATSKAMSGLLPTQDSAHSWQVYSAASLEDQAADIMICYPTQSHYTDTEPTSPSPILIMPSARLGSNKYQFESLWFDSIGLGFDPGGSGLEPAIFGSNCKKM